MAINKRKILQSAQKHLQKGALDKALKDYATLLEADPKDANIRLKVGDIHLKQGKTDEAVASYLKVAERFMKDGFDSKAIALYKQVTKIDSKRYDVYVPLSELYQRLGLSSDAMKALQTAADAHYRDGDKNQALDLLRKMATLDPSNTTNRLKVAELLRQEGREAEALAEYDEVVEELDRQGDTEGRLAVLQKILDLDPSRMATFVDLGEALVEQNKWGQAEATAETMIDAFPGETEGYELLAGIYQQSGRESDLPGVYRRLAEVYKERGDEDRARAIMQRFVSTEALGSEENGDPILGADEQFAMDAEIGGDGTLGMAPDEFTDPGFIPDESLRLGESISNLDEEDTASGTESGENSAASLPPLPPLESDTSAEEMLPEPEEEKLPEPEEDAEQLLAEASVYLRYGKHDRAIKSLRAILSEQPSHREALEKLGEALVASDDAANAITAFVRAAEAARDEGDDAGFESLRGRIEELDPAAAANLTPAPEPTPVESEPVPEAAAEGDLDLEEIEIEIDSGVEAETDEEVLVSDDSIEFEIEDDFGVGEVSEADDEAAAEPVQDEEPTLDSEDMECDFGDSDPVFVSDEDEDAEGGIVAPALEEQGDAIPEASLEETLASEALAPSHSAGSATTPQQMIEDLEEADFYFQQGLLEEAEEVYKRVLDAAPYHPQAMLRIGEIEAARGEPEDAAPEADSEAALESIPEVESAEMPPGTPEPEELIAGFEAGDEEPAPVEAEQLESGEGEFGMDLPDPSTLPDLEEVEELDIGIDPPEEHAAEATPATREATGPQAEATLPLVGETAESIDSDGEETDGAGDFDLAAELLGALNGEESGRFAGGAGGTTEEEGFEQVFAAFKQGVQQELGEGDIEAHYDLGIAYKEMGLLEDAIGEFRIALGGPARKLASLHAMGLCALDMDRVSDAIAHLEQALALPEVPTEQQTGLRFDLGRAYQQEGDLARAREAFEAVAAVDPDFGAVGERIAELGRSESSVGVDPLAAEQQEETFESFDDFIDGTGPPTETESYESFDDLMSDDEDDGVGEPEPEAAEPEMEAAPEPEPEAAEFEMAAETEAEELEMELAPESEPEAAELEMELAPEPEPEAAELEMELAPEPETEAAELEMELAPEPETEAAELEMESAPEPEPEAAEIEAEPAPKKPPRRKKISFV